MPVEVKYPTPQECEARIYESATPYNTGAIIRAAVDLYIASQPLPAINAATHVVVPREPTEEMCAAAWDSDATDYIGEHKRIVSARGAYLAMIAAAPPVQSAEGEVPQRVSVPEGVASALADIAFYIAACEKPDAKANHCVRVISKWMLSLGGSGGGEG
jgi:hypothetical protein